jgi:hypothetical protein
VGILGYQDKKIEVFALSVNPEIGINSGNYTLRVNAIPWYLRLFK